MAVATTGQITSLYSQILGDLLAFYDNSVLLPNPSLITNIYNLEGAVGNTIKIPKTNAYGTANVSVADNDSILTLSGTNQDFGPSNVTLSVLKRAAGSEVSMESMEDGGMSVVAGATTTRLARSLAQSTDVAGFRVMLTGAETALTDISDINVSNDGYANTAITDADLAVVFSPDAMAHAVKRSAEIKMFENIDKDNVQLVATVRNGFAQVYTNFIRAIATSGTIGAAAGISASLNQFAASVANLRAANAPTTAGGFYIAAVTPAQELALAKEINGVGGISSGTIGSVAQLAANDALLQNLISYAVGCQFVRSNNLPRGLASA